MDIPRASVIQISVLLNIIRYSGSGLARVSFATLDGYFDALCDLDVITFEVKQRLNELAFNALRQSARREA